MARFSAKPFQNWLRDNTVLSTRHRASEPIQIDPASFGRIDPEILPPPSQACAVFYNPTYRFIYVRNRKTASTTFLDMLRRALPPQLRGKVKPAIRMFPDRLQRKGLNLTQLWADYTVVTTVRNPWARAASGYEYTFEQWTERDPNGPCAKPPFLDYCRNPFIMGTLANLFQCDARKQAFACESSSLRARRQTGAGGDYGEEGGGDDEDYEGEGGGSGDDDGEGGDGADPWVKFPFYHVEPMATCLVTLEGRLVVDFVMRYEHLEDDAHAAIALINKRRPSGVPPLAAPSLSWKKMGTETAAVTTGTTNTAAAADAAAGSTGGNSDGTSSSLGSSRSSSRYSSSSLGSKYSSYGGRTGGIVSKSRTTASRSSQRVARRWVTEGSRRKLQQQEDAAGSTGEAEEGKHREDKAGEDRSDGAGGEGASSSSVPLPASSSAFVYADKYRQCGPECAEAAAEFFAADLQLLGWEGPGAVGVR